MAYLYLIVMVLELLLVISFFFCTGFIDSSIHCEAGIASPIFLILQGLIQVTAFFFGAPVVFLLILVVAAITQIVRAIYHYRRDQSMTGNVFQRFLQTPPLVRSATLFLLFQILLFLFGFLYLYIVFKKFDASQKMPPTHVTSDQGSSISLSPVQNDASQTLQVWSSQISNRFQEPTTELALLNNATVLNEIVIEYQKRSGRLPVHFGELSQFVPVLKPRFHNDQEMRQGIGWIYGVWYYRPSSAQYQLCIDVPSPPQDPSGATWKPYNQYYCLVKNISL